MSIVRGVALAACVALAADGAPRAPVEREAPSATSGEIAIGNLDAQVRSYEARVARAPDDGELRAALVERLITRGGILGCVADYERAEAIAEESVARRPDARSYRARASVRSALHRFDDALADLSHARSLGASTADAESSIRAAKGDLDGALALLGHENAELGTTRATSLGLLHTEMGHPREAERLLARARAAYRDVSPFVLAWIDYREGEIAERHGDVVHAQALYEHAHALVPRFTAAALHLAPYVAPADAVTMLERVRERSDDPEIAAALAKSLRRLGRVGEADDALRDARARYEAAMAHHPAAYADHAARFWLDFDPTRAHRCALTNLEARETSDSLDLALTTSLATHREEEACALARRSLSLRYADPSLRTVAGALLHRCR
jgi:tetratricopeptide (TPR) repeat protein